MNFVVACVLDEYKIGDKFTLWPLHVTVLPPFEAESLEQVVEHLQPITDSVTPLRAQLGDFAQFGQKNVVQKLIPNPELQLLHDKLLSAAESAGWTTPLKYTGKYYTPHITRKQGRNFEGNTFLIDKLAIAETQAMGYRTITYELPLKGVIE